MQYFSKENDKLESNPKDITAKIFDQEFIFTTDNGVFSKDYLDYATSLLLKTIEFNENIETVLDMGCGYGPVGIIVNKVFGKKVTMVDINPRALSLSKINVEKNKVEANIYESDCMDSINESFDMIISNPPIRAGKEIVYKIFEQSFDKLNDKGELWIIMQYSHGAPSAFKKLQTIFNDCKIVYKKKGFFVIKCTKLN